MFSKEFFKSSFSLVSLLMVPVVIALNVVGSYLNRALGLPLYLDAIGTIFLGVIAGPWIAGVGGQLARLLKPMLT